MFHWLPTSLDLLCFVAKRVARSLDGSGQTSIRFDLTGTSWSLSLRKKPLRGAQTRKVTTRSGTSVERILQGEKSLSTVSDPQFEITEAGAEYLSALR